MEWVAETLGDDRFEKHTPSIIAHFAQGYIAGRYIKRGRLSLGVSMLLLSGAYQFAGWIRKKETSEDNIGDTLRRDTRDYIAGVYLAFILEKDK